MGGRSAGLLQNLLRTKGEASLLSFSTHTLDKHCIYGIAITYRKLGGRVVYAIDDLYLGQSPRSDIYI